MFQRSHFRFAQLSLLSLVALLLGCSEFIEQPVSESQAQDAPPSRSTSLVQADDAPAVDLATTPATLPNKDASAHEVCKSFLNLLAQGERRLAEKLLTPRAFHITVAAGLELEPLGDPNRNLEVGPAAYATSRAKVAQVPCSVTAADGSKQQIQWLLRHLDSGWRVSGLITQSGKSSELLSLESKADVAAIVKSREQSPDQVRLVSATDEE